jgi:hypothetical protein
MKKPSTSRPSERITPRRAENHAHRTRAIADLSRRFDRLYGQLDLQLTRMADIQLQFDALRAQIKLL